MMVYSLEALSVRMLTVIRQKTHLVPSVACILIGAILAGCGSAASLIADSEMYQRVRETSERFPQMGLPTQGQPRYLVSLYLNQDTDNYPSNPHLAVMYYDRKVSENKLEIFKPMTGQWHSVFSLRLKDPKLPGIEFYELDQFPSHRLPGVVLWGGDVLSRYTAKVICFTNGGFKTVFVGHAVKLLDIDGNAIPEIYSNEDPQAEDSWTVSVWNGSEYVVAGRFVGWQHRFSNEIQQAVASVNQPLKNSKQEPDP